MVIKLHSGETEKVEVLVLLEKQKIQKPQAPTITILSWTNIESDERQTKWPVDLTLGHTTVKFKIYTGANVGVIPENAYLQNQPGETVKCY